MAEVEKQGCETATLVYGTKSLLPIRSEASKRSLELAEKYEKYSEDPEFVDFFQKFEAKKARKKALPHFPHNVVQWLGKVEDIVQQNEDLIGRRWHIDSAIFNQKFCLPDGGSFESGFKFLQTTDFVRNNAIYPFDSFQATRQVKIEECTIDQLDNLMQHWAEMLVYILTDNQERHPWFNTPSLHTFCALAVASLPEHFSLYSELYNVAKSYRELGNEKAEKDLCVSSMRSRVSASSSETKAIKPSLDLVLYNKINKRLDAIKSWWPVQVYTKIKKDKLKKEHQVHDGPSKKAPRLKSKRTKHEPHITLQDSPSGPDCVQNLQKFACKEGEVWVTRLPNMTDLPPDKQSFFDSFEVNGHKEQHTETWKEWLSTKAQAKYSKTIDLDL